MSLTSLLKAWLIILPAMIANGAFRELVLRRVVGPRMADVVSAAIGIAIIVALTRVFLRPLAGRASAELIRASVVLVALTVAFEFLFGHYVDGRSWRALAENYFIWRGHPWPAVLAVLAFMPFLWGRWSRKEARHAA